MRQAPSMTGLRVLEAVVRNGSLSAAARELCVTPAAVSHRLRDLELASGTALVLRSGMRFLPTDTGRQVLESLGDAFQRIRAADAILRLDKDQPLRIVSSYSFAVLWLAPRIATFQARHPGLRLFLHPSHTPPPDGQGDVTVVHAAQRPHLGKWALLFRDRCIAVARVDHPVFRTCGAGPDDVLNGRLVHVAHERGPAWGEYSWQKWAVALRLPRVVPTSGPTVSAEHMAVDLILAEDAFALVSATNASRLLADGRLRAVPGTEVETGCSYWVSVPGKAGAKGRMSADFLAWVRQELGSPGVAMKEGADAPSQQAPLPEA